MSQPFSLSRLLSPARKPIVGAAVLSGLTSVLTAVVIWVVGAALSERAPLSANLLWVLLALIGARAIAAGVVPVLRVRAFGAVRLRAQEDIYNHLVGVGPSIFDTRHTGDIVSLAVDAVGRVAGLGATFVPLVIRATTVPIIVGAIAMTIDLPTGLVIVGSLPLIALSLRGLEQGFRVAGDRLRISQDHLASRFLDAIASLETLLLFGAAEARARQLGDEAERVRKDTMDVLRVAQRALIGVDFVYSVVSVLAVSLVVLWRMSSGAVGGPEAVTLLLLSVVSISALVDVVSFFYVGGLGLAAVRRLKELFGIPDLLSDRTDPGTGQIFDCDVVLADVHYTYPGSDRPALNGVSLSIPAGTSLALIGASGAGKSTVAALVLGLRLPDQGEVLVGGVDVGGVDRGWLAKRVSYVGQQTHIFSASVIDNLRVGRPQASMEEMVEACRRARILEVVEALPEGFETRLGQGGRGLSGGEAQRIGIARAFLADPTVLVLDEATSGLDLDTEALVHEALSALMVGRTAIVIAHRVTTARECDLVAHLENGRIVVVGPPSEIGEGLFARMTGKPR